MVDVPGIDLTANISTKHLNWAYAFDPSIAN